MADLPSNFWGGWIVVLTVTSLLGLLWLLFSIYFSKSEPGENDEVTWDETLQEGSNPAPLWWFWLILGSMVFSVIYLMLYPGLGTYSGIMKWSQKGRIEESFSYYTENYDDIRQVLLDTPLNELHQDTVAMRSAQGIFDRNCAMCHGPEAQGMAHAFPSLVDAEWQWGGTPERIEQSIRAGRNARMPGWSNSLDQGQIASMVQYLQNLGTDGNIPDNDPGKAIYGQMCFSCHGTDGTGNINLGAPDLTNDLWLYGSSEAALTQTLSNGRNGIMPAFDDRLNDVQIHLLVAWLTRQASARTTP